MASSPETATRPVHLQTDPELRTCARCYLLLMGFPVWPRCWRYRTCINVHTLFVASVDVTPDAKDRKMRQRRNRGHDGSQEMVQSAVCPSVFTVKARRPGCLLFTCPSRFGKIQLQLRCLVIALSHPPRSDTRRHGCPETGLPSVAQITLTW